MPENQEPKITRNFKFIFSDLSKQILSLVELLCVVWQTAKRKKKMILGSEFEGGVGKKLLAIW